MPLQSNGGYATTNANVCACALVVYMYVYAVFWLFDIPMINDARAHTHTHTLALNAISRMKKKNEYSLMHTESSNKMQYTKCELIIIIISAFES